VCPLNKHNKSVHGVISVRNKKHSKQMMKVHMVHIIQLAIVLDMIDERKKNYLGGKNKR
jgi:hypothetical protein